MVRKFNNFSFLFPPSLSKTLQSSYPAPNVNGAGTGKTNSWPRSQSRLLAQQTLRKGLKSQRSGQVAAPSLKTALVLELHRRPGAGAHSALQPLSWIRGLFPDPHVGWRGSESPLRDLGRERSAVQTPQPRAVSPHRRASAPDSTPRSRREASGRGENTLRGRWAAAGLEGQGDGQREGGVHHPFAGGGRGARKAPGSASRAPLARHGGPVLRHSRPRLALSLSAPQDPSVLPSEDLARLSPPLPASFPLPGAHTSPFARPRFLPLIFGSFRPSSALSVQRRLPPPLRLASAVSDVAAPVRLFPPLPAALGPDALSLSGQVLVVSVGRGPNARPAIVVWECRFPHILAINMKNLKKKVPHLIREESDLRILLRIFLLVGCWEASLVLRLFYIFCELCPSIYLFLNGFLVFFFGWQDFCNGNKLAFGDELLTFSS